MKTLQFALLLGALCAFTAPTLARGDEGGDEDLRRAVAESLSADYIEGPRAAAQAYRRLFAQAGPDGIRRLADSKDLSVALQARYQLLPSGPKAEFDRAKPGHFPGFLEGDLGIGVPPTWGAHFASNCWGGNHNSDLLKAMRFYHELGAKNLKRMPNGRPAELVYSAKPLQRRPGPLGWRTVGQEEFLKVGHQYRVKIGDRLYPLDPRLAEAQARDSTDEVTCAAIAGKDRLFVVRYGDNQATCYTLFCLDAGSGEILWHQAVWGACAAHVPQMGGMKIWHEVELVLGDNVVAVFGYDNGVYLEGFDARNGTVLFRFSTSYWHE